MAKPSLPQGTRDFGPDVVRKRNYILDTIKNVFELYGFQPLETPAIENIETLMGKYGEEGDKLLYRIINSGSYFDLELFLNEIDSQSIKSYNLSLHDILPDRELQDPDFDFPEPNTSELNRKLSRSLLKDISEKGLRYDLTIPFARYVATNYNKLTFPFKRYQIQPVWRADRPQRGRYREFYQCDADVAGSTSLLTEVELLKIYDDVFGLLKIPKIEIKINSRSILKAFSALLGDENRFVELANILDKLDKVGVEETEKNLLESFGNLNINNRDIIEKFLRIEGNNDDKLRQFFDLFKDTLNKINPEVFGRVLLLIQNFDFYFKETKLTVDFSLARGLNYYTGLIIEVKCNSVNIGSIGGGGAYHNLTELFGVKDLPGVGISFGVDRIYDVMEELNLFPDDLKIGPKILFFNLGLNESIKCFELAEQIRSKHIGCEIYPDVTKKFDKQFKYAEKKNIPYVIIIGGKELEEGTCNIKDLRKGEQQTISQTELLNYSFS